MAIVDRIRITDAMMQAFSRASHDLNPLHMDAGYAARTPFGHPVVFGVLGLIAALGNVLRTMPLRIVSLRADFVRPLYVDRTYEVDVTTTTPDTFLLTLSAAGVVKQRIEFGFQPWSAVHSTPSPSQLPSTNAEVHFRTEAADPESASLAGTELRQAYVPDVQAVDELLGLLSIPGGRLPAAQLAALLWSSCCVGMEIPGRQALYARLDADFAAQVPASAALQVETRVDSCDPATGFVAMTAQLLCQHTAVAVGKLRIEALRRPDPVSYDVEQFLGTLGTLPALSGKRILITGASRGLGSLLALGAGASGAHVFLHHRNSAAATEALAQRIRSAGGKADVVQGDLADPAMWSRLKREVQRSGRGLDVLLHSAFTPILPMRFAELDSDQMAQDFSRNVFGVINGIQQMLPLLRAARGSVALISSVYVEETPDGFGGYAAQKAALEGLLGSLSKEETDLTFRVFRLPKLLSDQTNLNLDPNPPVAAELVAAKVLAGLMRGSAPGFHRIMDIFR